MRLTQLKFLTLLMLFTLTIINCSDKDEPTKVIFTFDDLMNEGWSEFAGKNYDTALKKFAMANTMDFNRPEAYAGMGWSLFKLDNLAEADTAFSHGSKRNGTADNFAGWAFSLNAQKAYLHSNAMADTALALSPLWKFQGGLGLDHNDLNILRAENHFLLGNFVESLAVVQGLNSEFIANVATSAGQAALAAEIERLKGTL